MSRFAAPIAEQIWDMKYRLKEADGTPIDGTLEDTWRRIARALAEPEADPALWEDRFYTALEDFRYLPAGRITAGAGTGRSVTLFNCFVMGTIPDSLEGIFQMLKEAALTMQQGGGIGYDFSTIRPRGAEVRGVAADASGPLSFMDVWDAMCRTIMSAGSRRGAMMATMRCDHPDIEAFIEAKKDPARLRMFNLSVLVTDAFMAAVKADGPWELTFDGRVFRTLNARDLWNRIMRSTYDVAEPGVIFIDRINRMNNLAYCEAIAATNPCVTAETWVHTTDGPRQVHELIGKPFVAFVDGKPHASTKDGFFRTGQKDVLSITTTAGRKLELTANHLVRKVSRRTRFSMDTEWVEAGSLCAEDEVVLHDHGSAQWGPEGEEQEQGYLLGHLIGDGVIREDKTMLCLWDARVTGDGAVSPAAQRVMSYIESLLRQMPHRADFAGWQTVADRNERRIGTGALRDLAARFGLSQGNKTLTPEIERQGARFTASILRGLFDADGTVTGTHQKGISVRLSQSDLSLLERVQRMLGRLGINARIYRNRRDAQTRDLPDGKGGLKPYAMRAQHEIIISGANLERFAERIGFVDTDKQSRLRNALSGYSRRLNREWFVDRIAQIANAGPRDVYDVRIPGINAFDANGLYVHNCGEQPLPPYGACLLGSVNLARLVQNPFAPDAVLDSVALDDLVRLAVRMMDNVVDVSRFPLPEQAAEAQAKRRIGLGVTGLADALLMLGLRYGSDRAAEQTAAWMRAIARAAYLASVDLAREKGPFPLFDADRYLASGSLTHMDEDVRQAIRQHGIRNALLTSIAPTGTISLYAGNVSSGIEPVFAYAYTRKVLQKDGSRTEEEVVDYAVQLWREKFGAAPLPDYFVNAQTLGPLEHVKMQAAAQPWVDSSISKTINCPEDISFDDFKDVYMAAWDQGCKGCTTYRPNDVTGSVLSVSEKTEAAPGEAPEQARREGAEVVYLSEPLDRPAALEGQTYKIKWPGSEHALYITINDVVIAGHRRPFEVFINSKNMEHFAWTVALTRMISAVFRRGGDVSFVVEELKAVFDPRGGAWIEGRYIPSILAAIGAVIENHLVSIGFIAGEGLGLKSDPKAEVLLATKARACSSCGSYDLRMVEGCVTCASCGFSKCG
jgi:ribonucleoside-diphosphate reductase alpha chain